MHNFSLEFGINRPKPAFVNESTAHGNTSCTKVNRLEGTRIFQGEKTAMIMTNKLLPVALIAALIGGSVGALVMHRSSPASAETTTTQNTARTTPVATDQIAQTTAGNNELVPGDFDTAGEQTAYK